VLRTGTRLALARVAQLEVHSDASGYVVVPTSRSRGAVVGVLHPRPQSSDLRPGPTAEVQLGDRSAGSHGSFSARIVPGP
jgi:hypothetical protein